MQKMNIIKIILIIILLYNVSSYSIEIPIKLFSIKPYPQNISYYFSKHNDDYIKPLLTKKYQSMQVQQFYYHYYDDHGLSPWNINLVKIIMPKIRIIEQNIIYGFLQHHKNNQNTIHYAENFKQHNLQWLQKIINNMQLQKLNSKIYTIKNNAIAINNTLGRLLPDDAPDFFDAQLGGQGFPFDNLQDSFIFTGTPLYVLHVSQDQSWSLVLTPDGYFSWIKSNDLAYTSMNFIKKWQIATNDKLVAITKTHISIFNQYHAFQFSSYIGAIFPLSKEYSKNTDNIKILIPIKNQYNQAEIVIGLVNKNHATIMPLIASKQNFSKIINELQNRLYGWGGAFALNDCSQELKNLFTPFGIWLPRNSYQQAQLQPNLDLSNQSIDARIKILLQKGRPLITLIYVNNHIMLYIGKKNIDKKQIAITYQNIWGLHSKNKDQRYVIGQALFLPLLKYYPQNSDIMSLADSKHFKLIYLDQLSNNYMPAIQFVKIFNLISNGVA